AVATGEALVQLGAQPAEGEGMAAGDVVNTAARLQTAAPVNGVLVGETTYRATRDAIEYLEHEPVVAKGKSDPVAVCEAVRGAAPRGAGRRDRVPGARAGCCEGEVRPGCRLGGRAGALQARHGSRAARSAAARRAHPRGRGARRRVRARPARPGAAAGDARRGAGYRQVAPRRRAVRPP